MSMLGLTFAMAIASAPAVHEAPANEAQCVGQSVLIESRATLRGAEAARAHEAVGRIVLDTPGLPNWMRNSFLRRTPSTAGVAHVVTQRTICSTGAGPSAKGAVDSPDLPNIPLDPNAAPGDIITYGTCDPITRYKANYTLRFVRDKDGNPATKDPGWIVDKVSMERVTAGCPVE